MNLPIDIYLDSGDIKEIATHANNPDVRGFTTNPTLMARAGVKSYEEFAERALAIIGSKPISFEVLSEKPEELIRQALKLQSWGDNISVKVPMMNSVGDYNLKLISELMLMKVSINVTAMISLSHVSQVLAMLPVGQAILSVFAGRLADTGEYPFNVMREAAYKIRFHPGKKLLWASVREPVNLSEAAAAGCDIVTVPPEMLIKAKAWYARDPDLIAAQTAKQFIDDANSAGLTL